MPGCVSGRYDCLHSVALPVYVGHSRQSRQRAGIIRCRHTPALRRDSQKSGAGHTRLAVEMPHSVYYAGGWYADTLVIADC